MDQALQTYRRVLQLRPGHGDANLALANLLTANDPDEALRLYNRALSAQPRNKEIPRAIAAIHQRRGFTSAEIVAYRRLLEIDPDDAAANRTLGTLLAQQRRHAEAIPFLEKAAQHYVRQGDRQTAAEISRLLGEIRP
ncbi:MAG: tetratricopeptide repeat protein [Oscillatoriales cyanobacterium SM2_1_8]|nr:tetratricopeptide repeat protein [Oscillatoriales cyanobacterium SM2_1_8]